MAIDPVSATAISLPQSSPGNAGAGSRFTQALHRMLEGTEQASGEANQKVAAMLDGSGDVHDAMIALQRAEMSLEMTVQVRNKLMSAYQEIMRMPV
jgi:flagellar hook-basal body complex protein FliE